MNMSNQLTPMQELINELEDTAKLSTNPIVTTTINLVIDIINSKLPKEQEVIEDAFKEGVKNMIYTSSNNYYNTKFKQR